MPPSLIALRLDAARCLALAMAADVVEGVDTFVGADCDGGCGGNLRHAVQIFGCDRLLEKSEAGAFDCTHVVHGFSGGEALVGVGRNQQAGPQRLADRARTLCVALRGIDADLDLVGGKARGFLFFRVAQVTIQVAAADDAEQRHAAALLLAKQRMHRLACGAADKVVERNFDRRLGAVVAVHAAVHGGQRTGNVGGLAVAQRRFEKLHGGDDAFQRLPGHAAAPPPLRPIR